jgi:SpoVK/Ycf46/Vps4 family AAA+-type ATPase
MNAEQMNFQIDRLIRARYPLIAIRSHEELRVLWAIDQIAGFPKQRDQQGDPKLVLEWAISTGMQARSPITDQDMAAKVTQLRQATAGNPPAVLKAIVDWPADVPAIFVLKDMHSYFNNAQVTRALRDAAYAIVSRKQTIILLSPQLTIPAELEKDVAIVDYPLPTKDEMAQLIDNLEGELGDLVRFNLNGDREPLARALTGLTQNEATAVLKQAIIAKGELNHEAIEFILDEKRQIVAKSGVLQFWPEVENYDAIGGLENLKAWLLEVEPTFTDQAKEFGLTPTRGVLIGGIPGTGKSLTAKAVAGGRHPRPLLRLSVSELLASGGGIVGQGQAKFQQALKVAEAVAPCVIWIDELEKGLGGGGGELDGGTRTDMMGDLLTWMQECKAPVFVVATANDVDALRPELVDRFDEAFFVDLPGPKARRQIFGIHLNKRGRDPEAFDLEALVAKSVGYSGREIERMVEAGLRKAFVRVQGNRGGADLVTSDILNAITETKPKSEKMAHQYVAYREWGADARKANSEDPEAVEERGPGHQAIEL